MSTDPCCHTRSDREQPSGNVTGRLLKKEKNSRKEFASIAKMYIFAACRGESPCPLCRLRAEVCAATGRRKENE